MSVMQSAFLAPLSFKTSFLGKTPHLPRRNPSACYLHPSNPSQSPVIIASGVNKPRKSASLSPLTLLSALPLLLNPMSASAVFKHNPKPAISIARNVSARPNPSTKLAVVPVASTLAPKPVPFSIHERVTFWFGEFLMWNPGAKVLTLLAFTLISMYLGSFLYRLADPKSDEAHSPFWHSVRAIANPLEDDWNLNALRSTSIFLAGIGMIVFAILVGMITESVETAVQLADGERSRVVISDHILVCGWSPHVTQILQGVNNVSSKVRVVVLASPREKVAMMDSIRSSLTEKQRRGMRIFFRTGAPIVLEDLKRVSADRAKKIILVKNLTGDAVDADRLVLSRAMAIRQNLPAFSGDIVAEVNSQRDEDLLQSIMADSNIKSVETINAEQLLFHFMAQAIRQPGLADVAAQLMGDNPNTIFHVASAKEVAPNLIGTRFADARPSSVAGSILCGFFSADGAVHIDTGSKFSAAGHIIRDDTDLLLLGTSQSSFGGQKYSNNFEKISQPMVSMMRSFNAAGEKALKPAPESYLVCGWRKDMRSMLSELDTVLTRGSSVTIIDEDAPDTLSLNLKNIKVSCVQKRADRYENLEALIGAKSNQFHHVVLLGSAIGDDSELRSRMGRDEDTKTLASLVYINELLSKQQEAFSKKKWDFESTMVTVEFINERVAAIAKEQGNVANAILPQNLSAKIAAQTVRDNRLNVVWRELLSQKGREIYLRPCRMYKDIVGERLSFGVIGDSLAKEGEDLLLGYISRDGKVSINPQGSEKVKNRMWNPSDMLIVLSHD